MVGKILKMEQDKQKRKSVNNNAVSLRNTLNELTGAEWLYFTKSILITAYPSGYGHELRKAHGANKPPQLMAQLIEFFTKPQGRVLAKSTVFSHLYESVLVHFIGSK